MNQTQLHTLAAEVSAEITKGNTLIAKIKDQLIEIEKDPVLTNSYKRMFIEQFQEQLALVRSTKAKNVELYSNVMRDLVEPIFDRMSVEADGTITNILIAEQYKTKP